MSKQRSISFIVLIVVVLAATGFLVTEYGFDLTNKEAHTIDVAGRQRMLSQLVRFKVAKGVDPESELEQMIDAHNAMLHSDQFLLPDAARMQLKAMEVPLRKIHTLCLSRQWGEAEINELNSLVDVWVAGMDQVNASIVEGHAQTMQRVRLIVGTLFALTIGFVLFQTFFMFVPAMELVEEKEDQLKGKEEAIKKVNSHLVSLNKKVAHDLKNPLQTISMQLELMHAKVKVGVPNIEEDLAKSQKVVDMLKLTVEQLLQGGDKSVMNVERIDLRNEYNNVLDKLHGFIEEKNAQVELRGSSFEIFGDLEGVRSILMNLISNSIKYSREGVEPLVVVQILDGREESILQIGDNGRGIATKELGAIFDPFKRLSEDGEGHGLGLYAVKQMVEAHGWTIEVESYENLGTQISIRMPKTLEQTTQGVDNIYRA